MGTSAIEEVLARHDEELLAEWLVAQAEVVGANRTVLAEEELRAQCAEFLGLMREALAGSDGASMADAAWAPVRDLLAAMASTRALQGFSPAETASFVFLLKRPLLSRLHAELAGGDPWPAVWTAMRLLDDLGLYTTEVHQRSREEVINRQQQELIEVSTPVVKLWDGVLALPLIGTLDSSRTQVVMEALLERVAETGARIAIIDITGVPTVDTLVAQHLLKTVAAARLMGAECLVSGIRPQIAQTIVHLGISLEDVPTRATLADAVADALARLGYTVPTRPDAR